MHVMPVPSLPSLKMPKMNSKMVSLKSPSKRRLKPLSMKTTFDKCVPPHLRHFNSVFSKDNFDELPKTKPWDHTVKLTSDANPKTCKIYLLSISEQVKLDAFLKENLKSSNTPLEVPNGYTCLLC